MPRGLQANPNRDDDTLKFPEQNGPVFLLGTCVLRDAVRAAVGEDSLTDIRGVLLSTLDNAVPGLDGPVAADPLIGAYAEHHRRKQPGDAELLERIGPDEADALTNLVRAARRRPPGRPDAPFRARPALLERLGVATATGRLGVL